MVYPSSRVVAGFLESNHETKVRVRDDGTFSDNRDRDGSTRVTVTSDGSGLEAWAHLTIRVPAGKTLAVYLKIVFYCCIVAQFFRSTSATFCAKFVSFFA